MQKTNNVIELKRFRKEREKQPELDANPTTEVEPQITEEKPEILDMTARRKEMIQDERRKVRRTILTGFIGAFVVVPKKGLLKVDLYDISENGIAFDLALDHGQFRKGEELAMRVYLSRDTYFPFVVRVQNQRQLEGEPASRHGTDFVKGTVNDEALFHFVKFIETVSTSLERDQGDMKVSNYKK